MRRRRPRTIRMRGGLTGWAVVLALVIIVTGAAGLPYFVASEDAQRPEQEPQLITLGLPPGITLAAMEKGRVEKVIDGDTIDVSLSGRTQRIRYYGVDTPERGDKCYREAADRNEMLVGKEVLLLTDARSEDSFGRLLRYVFLSDGTSVDATLVAEGFGKAWTQDGQYKDSIISIEGEARSAGRGCLWKSAG